VLVEFPAKVADGRGHNDLNYDGPENLWWVSSQNLDKTQAEVLPAPFRPGSQPSKILSHLLKGKDITNNESMLVYHIYRLSDCIHKIREAGYEVVTEIKKDEVGGKYSSYRLAAKAA
jgi:Helix-turn-helix domain